MITVGSHTFARYKKAITRWGRLVTGKMVWLTVEYTKDTVVWSLVARTGIHATSDSAEGLWLAVFGVPLNLNLPYVSEFPYPGPPAGFPAPPGVESYVSPEGVWLTAEAAEEARVAKRHRRVEASLRAKHPGLIEMLDVTNNTEVARKYGFSRERIRQFREILDIDLFIKEPKDWSEIDPLLGVLTDVELANRFGVSHMAISGRRRDTGIPSVGESRREEAWDKLESIQHLIGKQSDLSLCKKYKLKPLHMQQYREEKGIPPFMESPAGPNHVPLDRGLIRELFEKGANDREIAEAVGSRSPMSIAIIRRGLGLVRRRGKSRGGKS